MTWPGCLERSHIEAFSAKSESFSYSASDGLGLYAALRAYLYDLRIHLSEDSAEDTAAAMSFFGLCDVIALCHASMRKAISANELEGLTETHLKRFVQAHGIESTVPKHHLCQHLSRCLRTQKYLLSCFVHERKHKQIKHFADMLHNTGSWFNRKILMETRCTRISQVVFSFFSIILLFFFGNQISHSKFSMPYHLVVAPCKDVTLDQVQKLQAMPVSSDGVVLHGQVATLPTGQGCKKGDVVQCSIENRETFGQVVRHEQTDGACRSLIHVWPQRGSHLEKRSDEGVWVETSCIQGSLTWKTLPGNLVKVVPQKF